MRSMVAASNRSVAYSQRKRNPAADSRTDSVRSNLAARLSSGRRSHRDTIERKRSAGRVLQHEHHLEQRMAAQVARGSELLDELLEGQVLVGVGSEGRVAHPREQLAKGRIARQVGAQHQRVDEEPDQALQLGAAAPGDRRADRDVVWPL